ncbi:MAG: ATP-binding cassette domain-containing protein [Caldilineaceae bacterium]
MIGPNGTGKTTFLRTLMGQMEPLGGKLQFGASLKIGYLAQSQDKFNPETACWTSCSITSTCCWVRRAPTWRSTSSAART